MSAHQPIAFFMIRTFDPRTYWTLGMRTESLSAAAFKDDVDPDSETHSLVCLQHWCAVEITGASMWTLLRRRRQRLQTKGSFGTIGLGRGYQPNARFRQNRTVSSRPCRGWCILRIRSRSVSCHARSGATLHRCRRGWLPYPRCPPSNIPHSSSTSQIGTCVMMTYVCIV